MGKLSRIGILTGGGDCPGLNAVIRAVAKMALTHLDVEVIGFLDGFAGLVVSVLSYMHVFVKYSKAYIKYRQAENR